jgi:hypothetical protein
MADAQPTAVIAWLLTEGTAKTVQAAGLGTAIDEQTNRSGLKV